MIKQLNFRKLNRSVVRISIAVLALAAVLVAVLGFPGNSQAHCDSVQGPVVAAARQALETGDVNQILPYIQAEQEAELTAVFQQTLQVRSLSSEAQTLADRYFFETAVRLHREGEGAAYTGLKDEEVPLIIQAADEAIVSGDLAEVNEMLSKSIDKGVELKYKAVVEARKHAEKEGTVEAHRELVEAQLMFEKYLYELQNLATGSEVPAEGGHSH